MKENDFIEDMKQELKEREEDYNKAEEQRKKGLRVVPTIKPNDPSYKKE